MFILEKSITVDASGHIYVVDHGNDRIEKFDSNGTFITAWGSLGTSNGQFNEVTDVTVFRIMATIMFKYLV
jgi:DNA-binding beta-propeller fold protein YncE